MFGARYDRCSDCTFGYNLYSCKNCFGCVYLKGKEYHILNQPYEKEEYFRTKEEIIQELKEKNMYSFDLLFA